MLLCTELSVFVFLFLIFYYTNSESSTTTTRIYKSIFWSLFLLIIYTNYINTLESFHFEVTPWKKTCLNDHPYRCNGCCLPGFNGKAINFAYTGDAERMNMAAAGCTERDPNSLLKNHANDYSHLGNTYGSVEGYSLEGYHPKSGSTYGTLGSGYTARTTFPILEGYNCGVEEEYCGASHNDVVEGYCGACGDVL